MFPGLETVRVAFASDSHRTPQSGGPGPVAGREQTTAASLTGFTQAEAGDRGPGRAVLQTDGTPSVSGPTEIEYAENGEEAVATYSATGLTSDSTGWSLSGEDGTAFEITDGVLTFLAVPDYEKPSDADADNVYEVTVTAADTSPASASVDATITVTDVNDLNIIVIMADDAGHEVFGAYGSTQYSTPRLDAIAAAGARFEWAFSKPLCAPSRFAIMTGQSNVRNYTNWNTMLNSEYTFADLFSDADYATAVAGKWQLNLVGNIGGHRTANVGRGFDTYCLYYYRWRNGVESSRYWEPLVACDGYFVDTAPSDYGPDMFVDFFLDFIESNQRRPFFVYYPMALPHRPFHNPPGGACEATDVQCQYQQMVTRMDDNVGRIYDKLETLDLLDNTLLLFTADNATPRMIISDLHGEVLYGEKGMPTDGGTRVPLIAHVPGQTGSRVISDLIDITDIFPTVAEAAGIEVPSDHTLDGVSFWDRMQGDPGRPREWIYTYYWPQPSKPHHDDPPTHPEIAYARGSRYKLYSTGELFDLQEDRFELFPLPSDDAGSTSARESLQAVLDSMPDRGLGLIPFGEGFGTSSDGVQRPRLRPMLRAAEVSDDRLTLSYAGTVVTSPTPPVGSFAVQADGNTVSVTAVEISVVVPGASEIELTLASKVTGGQNVVLSYTPGSNSIRHDNRTGGHYAAPLSEIPVVNSTHNDPPTITGPAQVRYPDGGSDPVSVYSASDPQGNPVIWSLSGPDAEHLALGIGGTLSFEDSPEFESPGDEDLDNVYSVIVEASDGLLTTTLAVAITVTNEDEPGGVEVLPLQPQIDDPVSVALTDPDGEGGGGVDDLPDGPTASASDVFEDVAQGSWYESAVSWMVLNEITSGCSPNRFCPDANLTRQQFITFLWRAAGRPKAPYLGSQAFVDAPEGGYAEESIGWAVATGVTRGCGPGQYGDADWRFCPQQPVTRGQMAALLFRQAEADHVGAAPPHTDVAPDRFYAPGIVWLTHFQVVPGCGPNLFCPDSNATRAEAALFINGVAIRPHIMGQGNTFFTPPSS